MYITYDVVTGSPVLWTDTVKKINVAHYCLRFRDEETARAAWIADATVYQAINAFGGVEIYNAI